MHPINIIGGGIGGLTLANALQRQGIDYCVYEQADQLTEVGAAIGLSHAAVTILENLGIEIKSSSTSAKVLHLTGKDLQPFRVVHVQTPGIIIHHARLIEILQKNLPKEKIHLNKKLSSIDSSEESSTLTFTDNTIVTSACTVMADGIHSLARKQFYPKIALRYANQIAWRGIAPFAIPEEYRNVYVEMWHDTRRFIFSQLSSDTICWVAVTKGKPNGKHHPETAHQELLMEFHPFHPLVGEILEKTPEIIRNDIADLGEHHFPWYHNRNIFLGDAIHATTPNLAQGGCMAIEDAYCLSLLLNRYSDMKKVGDEYWTLRKKKTNFVVSTSWQYGNMIHSTWQINLLKSWLRIAPDSFFFKQERFLNDLSYLDNLA